MNIEIALTRTGAVEGLVATLQTVLRCAQNKPSA